MSYDQTYPFPQVFLVDGGGGQQHADQPPSLVPCWSFPPAQERLKSRGKSQGCMGVSYGVALIVLMLFLLVFAALGFEAYQIDNLQKDLRNMTKTKPESFSPQKQIGFDEDKGVRHAAHVTGRIEREKFSETLRWDPHGGRAFTSGAVAYHFEDGALQVNNSGLYHVYSRVEMTFKDCSLKTSFIHSVFLRREALRKPVKLMVAHRAGFCSQQSGYSITTESYLGSTLQLQKYDRVFVNVSHPTYLSHEHYANFFGLYKI